jgi:hypothetical protein
MLDNLGERKRKHAVDRNINSHSHYGKQYIGSSED